MDLAQILGNIVTVLVSIGLPLFALLILATEMSKWYQQHPDPPPEAFEAEEHH